VFNTIQTSDHVTVTVERGGQRQEISLNIAQVAAQATHDLDGDPSAAPAPASPNGVPPAPANPGLNPNDPSNE
jgi:hypothetical protein